MESIYGKQRGEQNHNISSIIHIHAQLPYSKTTKTKWKTKNIETEIFEKPTFIIKVFLVFFYIDF